MLGIEVFGPVVMAIVGVVPLWLFVASPFGMVKVSLRSWLEIVFLAS